MRTLNGQEASILAIIAQCPNLDEAQINKLLKSLQDDSLLIALVMLNRVKNPSEEFKMAADGFISWAKNLKSNNK